MDDKDYNFDENRIIDEALKRVSKGKVRIEDMQELSNEMNDSLNELSRHVLNEIVADVRKQTEWSIKHGAPPLSLIKTHFAIQSTLLTFLGILLRHWIDVSSQALAEHNIQDFKDTLGEEKK